MNAEDVVIAWDRADLASIHPTRAVSELAYRQSGEIQARQIATLLAPDHVAVDFGCGDGRVAIPLRQLGFDVIGVDSSSNMLANLTIEDPGMRVIKSDGSDLRVKLGHQVDLIYCLAVLIHHGYDDGVKIVTALRDSVRSGGLLVLDWPISDDPVERQAWNEVTTWSFNAQQTVIDGLGLRRVSADDVPWLVFQA